MKRLTIISLTIFTSIASAFVFAQVAEQLEQACLGDAELAGYVVQILHGEEVPSDMMSDVDVQQIKALFASEKSAALSMSEKLDVVKNACSQGRILQHRNSYILNPQ